MGEREGEGLGAVIGEVEPGGIAAGLGLAPGDRILRLNGRRLTDLIRLRWEWAGEDVLLEAEAGGAVKTFPIKKEYDAGLGVRFETPVFDGVRRCGNRCRFCFVDQMPPGCRPSLYVKDDDFRLSFLQGSFVTLTNLGAGDWRRIERERLSPLYVSVHATDPVVRGQLLGRPGGDSLMAVLRRLDRAGIEFHGQVVLCPGDNDGPVLERTAAEFGALAGSLSLAVVPVGLTGWREGLPALRTVSSTQAGEIIDWAEGRQAEFLAAKGSRFLWLSDEFYCLAGRPVPEAVTYEDYPQWENGVGLIRGLLDEAAGYAWPARLERPKHLVLAGGVAAMRALAPLWERLGRVEGVSLRLAPVENRFFGPSVDVSGLITGSCLIAALGALELPPGSAVYLPEVMVRDRPGEFLDGLTTAAVSEALGLRLVFLPAAGDLLAARLLAAE